MDARLLIAIIIPSLVLLPALILFLSKKKMIEKALIKYQRYESGEEKEEEDEFVTNDYDVIEMNQRGKYHHVSYDSLEEAEQAFSKRYTIMTRILVVLGIGLFMFLYYTYIDFKNNLIVEGDTIGSFGLEEGAPIPRSRFEFEVKEGQSTADFVISFNDYIEWEYEANIYVQIFDPQDSLIVFEMDRIITPSVDGDDNIAFSSQDTTVYFNVPGNYVLDYYTMTLDIPTGHFYLKAN